MEGAASTKTLKRFFLRNSSGAFKEAAYNQWHEQSGLIKGQRTFSWLINAEFRLGSGVLCSGTIGGQSDCVGVCMYVYVRVAQRVVCYVLDY